MYMNIQCFIVLNGNGVEVTFLSLNYWENNWCKDCHGSVESFDWCELVWVCYLGEERELISTSTYATGGITEGFKGQWSCWGGCAQKRSWLILLYARCLLRHHSSESIIRLSLHWEEMQLHNLTEFVSVLGKTVHMEFSDLFLVNRLNLYKLFFTSGKLRSYKIFFYSILYNIKKKLNSIVLNVL